MLLNRNFKPSASSFEASDWRVLIIDSLPTSQETEDRASQFALWLLQLKTGKIDLIKVDVPKQLSESNDCGILVAHFLRIFLRSFKQNTKLYSSVSSY